MSVVTKENNPELYNALFPEDKIKETINILYDFATNVNSDYIYDAHSFDYPLISDCIEELLDYITNLQDRIKELEQINEEHRKLNGELREKNERLREENKHIFANVNDDQLLRSNAMNYAELQDYKARNEKAIEKCKNKQWETNAPWLIKFAKDVENILQGKSDE